MIKTLVIATGLSLAVGAASAQEPILQSENLFAVITDVNGKQISATLVHSVLSRNAATMLPVRSVFHGKQVAETESRVSICITELDVYTGGALRLSPVGPAFPHEGCLGQLHDYFGAAGVEKTDLHKGAAVRVYLNGDLYNADDAGNAEEDKGKQK